MAKYSYSSSMFVLLHAVAISCIAYTSLMIHPAASSAATHRVINVIKYGAKPDGRTDSTKPFLDAWDAACTNAAKPNSVDVIIILVPKGRYVVGLITFKGSRCLSRRRITFQIDGTIVAPLDYKVLGDADSWIAFQNVTGLTILGGSLDAKGTALWTCKATNSNIINSCPEGATSLRFTYSRNVRVKGITSLNSQKFHISFNHCQNVAVDGAKVIAADESPNTDGIHIENCRNVEITNSRIKTGDDCISIGPGSKNLWIQGIRCGPGHGISIGSLARDAEEEGVQNVTVLGTLFAGTTNGLRIKSWARASTGFVRGIRFMGAVMSNVKNPIIIDQNYCPDNVGCPGDVSGVGIRDVVYQDVRGTSATEVAVRFDCSGKVPCRGIRLQNVNLKHVNKEKEAKAVCVSAFGKSVGVVQPRSCL